MVSLLALGYTLIMSNLRAQGDASLVDLAGRQRMYVERLTRQLLTESNDPGNRAETIAWIRRTTTALLDGGPLTIRSGNDQTRKVVPLHDERARGALLEFRVESERLFELADGYSGEAGAIVNRALESEIFQAGVRTIAAADQAIETIIEAAAADAKLSYKVLSLSLVVISVAGLLLLVISHRHFKDRELQTRRNMLLSEVGLAFTKTQPLRAALQSCTESMHRHLDIAFSRIWLLNHETQILELEASSGTHTHIDGPHNRVPVGKYNIGRIAETKTPRLTNQVIGDSSVGDQEWVKREGMKAFAGYPLILDDRVEGVLATFSKKVLPESALSVLHEVANAITLGVVRHRAEAKIASLLTEMREVRSALDEHAVVTIIDVERKITYVNERFCDISKFTQEEAIGRGYRFNKSEEQPEAFYEELWETVSSGQIWRGEIKNSTKDDNSYWVDTTIVPFFDKNNKPWQYISIQSDISNSKRTQQALDKERHLLHSLMENAPVSIYFKDKNSRYFRNSRAHARRLGVSDPEQLLGKSDSDFFDPEHANQTLRDEQQVIRTGRGVHKEERETWPDGSETWTISNKMPIRDKNGIITGTFGISQDITERKQAEKELEAFSYSVSHDLRAPIRHIEGYAELLKKQLGDDLNEKARRYIQIIGDSTLQMGKLIDDLLGFSRMSRTELHMQTVDLNDLVNEVLTGLAPETEGRNIVWEKGSLPTVSGDPDMLKQVFVNLLSNAVKYTNQRNPAKIEYGTAETTGNEVVIFVRDNGAGFDMKYNSKLFKVFQRLHKPEDFEGTGIGLANVRRVITRHKGRTWAEGKIDVGATFYFSLPRVKTNR